MFLKINEYKQLGTTSWPDHFRFPFNIPIYHNLILVYLIIQLIYYGNFISKQADIRLVGIFYFLLNSLLGMCVSFNDFLLEWSDRQMKSLNLIKIENLIRSTEFIAF